MLSQCHADIFFIGATKLPFKSPAINTPATPQPMFPSIYPPVQAGSDFSLEVSFGVIQLTQGLRVFILCGNAMVPAGHVFHKADAPALDRAGQNQAGLSFGKREVAEAQGRCVTKRGSIVRSSTSFSNTCWVISNSCIPGCTSTPSSLQRFSLSIVVALIPGVVDLPNQVFVTGPFPGTR